MRKTILPWMFASRLPQRRLGWKIDCGAHIFPLTLSPRQMSVRKFGKRPRSSCSRAIMQEARAKPQPPNTVTGLERLSR